MAKDLHGHNGDDEPLHFVSFQTNLAYKQAVLLSSQAGRVALSKAVSSDHQGGASGAASDGKGAIATGWWLAPMTVEGLTLGFTLRDVHEEKL